MTDEHPENVDGDTLHELRDSLRDWYDRVGAYSLPMAALYRVLREEGLDEADAIGNVVATMTINAGLELAKFVLHATSIAMAVTLCQSGNHELEELLGNVFIATWEEIRDTAEFTIMGQRLEMDAQEGETTHEALQRLLRTHKEAAVQEPAQDPEPPHSI